MTEPLAPPGQIDCFVALATSATSADPWKGRLIALSAVRVRRRSVEAELHALYNPGTRVPNRLLQALSLTYDDLADLPRFQDQLDELRSFIGSLPLVGVEIATQLDRISRELAWLNEVGLSNPIVELLDHARLRLEPRKPTLQRLAAQYAVPHPRPDDPRSDARTVAALALRLSADASMVPARERVLAEERSGYALRRPDPPPAPRGPGVYLLRDRGGRVLYVGSSRDLSRRVRDYHLRQLGLERRLPGLAEQVHEVETISAASHLEAALLEARLIREHAPPFNTQRAIRWPRLYLRVDIRPGSAGLALTSKPGADGVATVGPLRTSAAALGLYRLLRAALPELRGRRRRDAAQRAQAAAIASDALAGRRDGLLDLLQRRQRAFTAASQHSESQEIGRLLREAVHFELPEQAAADPGDGALLVLVASEPGAGTRQLMAYLIAQHRLLACLAVASRSRALAWARGTLAQAQRPRDDLDRDEPAIVARWLARLDPNDEVVSLGRPTALS